MEPYLLNSMADVSQHTGSEGKDEYLLIRGYTQVVAQSEQSFAHSRL